MKGPVLKLVIKDSWYGDIQIGWRHLTDGVPDVMWGATRNDVSLWQLLAQMKSERQRGGESDLEIVDERIVTRGEVVLPKQLFEI